MIQNNNNDDIYNELNNINNNSTEKFYKIYNIIDDIKTNVIF